MKLIIATLLFLTPLPAMAVVVTVRPPIVPPEQIAHVETIPANRTVLYHKGGKMTIIEKPERKICFDYSNRKVQCPVEMGKK